MASVRHVDSEQSADVARLLHDFNTEFDDFTPGVEFLEGRMGALLGAGEADALLVGDPAFGLAVLRFRQSLWSESLDSYLEELYVAPDRRGSGHGRALLEAAFDLARERGAGSMHLCTSVDDRAAIALYESSGFTNREGPPDGPSMLFYERDL